MESSILTPDKADFTLQLEAIIQQTFPSEIPITGLSIDSRTLMPGNIFMAYPGSLVDGRNYIHDAIAKGASCILCDGANKQSMDVSVPLYYVNNLKSKVGLLASAYYYHPSRAMSLVGITGTNGKTTTSWLISRALNGLQRRSGVMGTLGNGLVDQTDASPLTTRDAIYVNQALREFVNKKATHVAMEVSSHAIDQGRVNGLTFDVGVFTNLSRDHLDYHESIEAYTNVKRQFFIQGDLRRAVINSDDDLGVQLQADLYGQLPVYSYSAEGKPANHSDYHLSVISVRYSVDGFIAIVQTPYGEIELRSKLIGAFNLQNLLAALCTLISLGVSLKEAVQALACVQSVPGRMETFAVMGEPLVIIDYAHTPDALISALKTVKGISKGRVFCVFGCGGERDRGKRPIMARAAERYSNHVILTDDNPRGESAAEIFQDITAGFLNKSCVLMEHDRRTAIIKAIDMACPDDIVLITGKGHETHQIINNQYLPFSDAAVVRATLKIF